MDAARLLPAEDPLPSWNDGLAKERLLDFVARATGQGAADYVPVAERIAVFDNDGTLWTEQPAYTQFFFGMDRVKAKVAEHPEWREKQPFKSVLANDLKGVVASGVQGLAELSAMAHADINDTEEFERDATGWLASARHPRFQQPFTECVYLPMLELLAYLRAHAFKTCIVSGGAVEFIRPWAERVYGIPREQVIGSTVATRLESRDDKPVIVRLPAVDSIVDKEHKVLAIQRVIGRRPIAAFGNSDSDLPMLEWTAAGAGPRLCLCVHHTDAEREYAYDRDGVTGRLNEGLDTARVHGWTVVDMKADWKQVFAFEKAPGRAREKVEKR